MSEPRKAACSTDTRRRARRYGSILNTLVAVKQYIGQGRTVCICVRDSSGFHAYTFDVKPSTPFRTVLVLMQ
jgi:hypothetical protein